MLIFTLEMFILWLFFRWILGYEYQKKIVFIVGCILLAGFYLGQIVLHDETVYQLYWLWEYMKIIIPLFFLKGRYGTILGLSCVGYFFFSAMENLSWGIGWLVYKDAFIDKNWDYPYLIAIGCVLLVALAIAYHLRGKRERIYSEMEQFSSWIPVPSIILMIFAECSPWYLVNTDNSRFALFRAGQLITAAGISIISMIMLLLVYALTHQQKESKRLQQLNERCVKEQTAQYKFALQKDTALRRFRHDHNAHLTALQALAKTANWDALQKYLDDLTYMHESFSFIHTNHVIGDAIVNQYCELGKRDDVKIQVTGRFPEDMCVDETDLCILLSNGMQNAYEAAKQCENDRIISVEIKHTDALLFLHIQNPSAVPLDFQDGLPVTTKANRETHGMGTRNMKDAVERIGGTIQWRNEENHMVHTEIILPLTLQ